MNLTRNIITIIVVLLTINVTAQKPGRERIKTLKVAYITEQLNLSTKEAQNFWPIYNAHEEQKEKIRKEERENFSARSTDLSSISDGEAEKILVSLMKLRAKKVKTEESYIKNLKKVISSKKIVQLIKAENTFKKRLLQQYRKKRDSSN